MEFLSDNESGMRTWGAEFATWYARNLVRDDVIKWKHFPRYWPFVRGIHRSPVNSPHKGQWRRALVFSLICVWVSGWVNSREAGDLRRYRAHYDVTAMCLYLTTAKHSPAQLESWGSFTNMV